MEYINPKLETNRRIVTVDAGHMFYDKCIVHEPNQPPIFIKGFNEARFTCPIAAESTKQLLIQEADAYDALSSVSYKHLPDSTVYDHENNILYMNAHLPEDGWHWSLPDNTELQNSYINDVFQALYVLETIPANILKPSTCQPALDEIYEEGWVKLQDKTVQKTVLQRLESFEPYFHNHAHSGIDGLRTLLNSPMMNDANEIIQRYISQPRPAVAHFDARQSNIAWHPKYGVKIVDWSWASAAPHGADRTMFLIDVFKTGLDVSALVDHHLEPNYALLQMGHWLVRGARPSSPGDNNVRFHQMASAVSAATLLF